MRFVAWKKHTFEKLVEFNNASGDVQHVTLTLLHHCLILFDDLQLLHGKLAIRRIPVALR